MKFPRKKQQEMNDFSLQDDNNNDIDNDSGVDDDDNNKANDDDNYDDEEQEHKEDEKLIMNNQQQQVSFNVNHEIYTRNNSNTNGNDEEQQQQNETIQVDAEEGRKKKRKKFTSSFYLEEQSKLFPFYAPPKQRHRWGDHQDHPHTDWDDIFYDLFFVSAAYNLGNQLRYHPTGRGLLYFLGCLLPLQTQWQFHMYFDARFQQQCDDTFHRIYDAANLLVMGLAVLHIKPVLVLSQLLHNSDMFSFALAITVLNLLALGRLLEVYVKVDGTPAARINAKYDMVWILSSTLLSLPATIYAAVQFYGANGCGNPQNAPDYVNDRTNSLGNPCFDPEELNEYGDGGDYAAADNNTTTTTYAGSGGGGGHRYLAGQATSSSSSYGSDGAQHGAGPYGNGWEDIPIYLLCASWILPQLVFLYLSFKVYINRRNMVPLNINYCIHRYGAWTMLMLGETVLSLLIVEVRENEIFYRTFYSGIITITLLQFIHFQSQPHDPEKHALHRKVNEVCQFTMLKQIYSAALISLGASYKMYLYADFYAGSYGGGHRRRNLFSLLQERFLAGSSGSSYNISSSMPDLDQTIAYFYCGSLAIVFACTDLMMLTHGGMQFNQIRFRNCKSQPSSSIRGFPAAVLFLSTRIGFVLFVATLCLYLKRPQNVTFTGVFITFFQLLLRYVGEKVFPEDDENNNGGIARRQLHFYVEKESINWLQVSKPLNRRETLILNNQPVDDDDNEIDGSGEMDDDNSNGDTTTVKGGAIRRLTQHKLFRRRNKQEKNHDVATADD